MSRPRAVPADAAKEAFKQEIRIRRAIYDVKQKDIADELGVAQPAVSGLLSNPDKITAERMRKIVVMLRPDPKVVLAFLGYSQKEIRKYFTEKEG